MVATLVRDDFIVSKRRRDDDRVLRRKLFAVLGRLEDVRPLHRLRIRLAFDHEAISERPEDSISVAVRIRSAPDVRRREP
jgi:hypothetical protein